MTDIKAILPKNFDPSTYEEQRDTESVVPAGWYLLHVERVEIRDFKNDPGKKLSIAFVIDGPRYANRWIFVDFNIAHSKEQTREIALEQYAQLCRALGTRGDNIDALIGKRLDGKVTIRKQEGWDDRNDIQLFAKPGTKVKSPAPAAPAASPITDDDMPF